VTDRTTALGIGRAGTMLGPILGSLMVAAKLAPPPILFSTALPAALAAVAILMLGRRLRRMPLGAPTRIG
jgi:MFS transporter, AAHS family, 4-hydroxybenzoate transporter